MTVYDLGNGITATTTSWSPDRELNPQYAGRADIDPCGLIIDFPDGCSGSVLFNLSGMSETFVGNDLWELHSLDPLHIEPSVLEPGMKLEADHRHHGWIRDGKWVDA